MENNELNDVVVEEGATIEIDENMEFNEEQPVDDMGPEAISEIDSTLGDGEMKAMDDEEAFNRDLYANMTS